MEYEASEGGFALILGRPSFMTTKSKIDVHVGTLSIEFKDTYIEFNIFEALKHSTKDHSTFSLDSIDGLMEEASSDSSKQTKAVSDSENLDPLLNRASQPTPPNQEYPLPEHLKYAYLGDNQQFSVIIANNLHKNQEEKLLKVLKKHKKAIGWTLTDLPEINPFICMHKILLEENARPVRQQQRRLNLTLLDVVKKEVTKLLPAGIIYPTSDSH
ncbi:hypothetical protein CR513_19175, partial [Mucuna pruriens]